MEFSFVPSYSTVAFSFPSLPFPFFYLCLSDVERPILREYRQHRQRSRGRWGICFALTLALNLRHGWENKSLSVSRSVLEGVVPLRLAFPICTFNVFYLHMFVYVCKPLLLFLFLFGHFTTWLVSN